jgi:predicted phage-related endonuclease
MIANIDRFIVDDEGKPIGVLECKTAGSMMDEYWSTGEIPLSYLYQLQWYLHITGLIYGAIACLVGGNKFYYYEVIRDDDLLNNKIIPAVTKFWEYNVANLIEPKLDGTQASTDFINKLAKDCVKNSELYIEEDEYNGLLETIQQCKKQIKEIENIQEEAMNRVKDKLREYEIGYTADYICRWSSQTQNRIDTDALKLKYPEIALECTKQISFRKFTVKGKKV